MSYDVVFKAGTTIVPTIHATANELYATVVITQATSVTGTATVVVTAQDGTTTKTYTVNFSVATSINTNSLTQINVYPSVTSNNFNVKSSSDILLIKVYDLIGKMVDLKKMNSKEVTINVVTWEKGAYLVNIITSEGNYTRRVIVR